MIIENGVHDISNDIYHESEGISRSGLWAFKTSPLHYWHKYLNPLYERPEPSPAFVLGNLVHTMILEPHLMDETYSIQPQLEKPPKVGLLRDLGRGMFDFQKQQRAMVEAENERIMSEFELTSSEKIIIKRDDYDTAVKLAESFNNTPHAPGLIEGLDMERSIYWTHEPTGLQCKARPDAWKNGLVIDLKTSKSAGFRSFQSSAVGMGYYLQAAMINEALKSIGITMENFAFIVIEKTEPFAVGIYTLDTNALLRGIEQFNELMFSFAKCKESNNWPGYGIQELTWPNYANYDIILDVEE
jgi:exodeoxyribonuclease VIII